MRSSERKKHEKVRVGRPKVVHLASPRELAVEGERIYAERRDELEKTSSGKFAAIDVSNQKIYVADGAAEALVAGRRKQPNAILHLVKIGDKGAYKIGFSTRHAGPVRGR